MTNIEQELITLIRENESPEQALLTALLIIGRALEQSTQRQPQDVQEQPVGVQREFA